MDETIYYNALALAADGDYGKMEAWSQRSETWKERYAALKENRLLPDSLDPEQEWNKAEKLGIKLILFDDPGYPPLLREIPQPPLGIYILGTLPSTSIGAGQMPIPLAIVGTRRATPDGKATARRFARELATAGFTIVSGLAFGIDAAAHEGCLECGGRTIAVLAGGLDRIYPASNRPLAENILTHGGAIISEYPVGQPPYESRFLERNRIVSGLSRGTLVIEAPEQSGSLVTARHAFEQNRDLFVVPGPITHRNFKASHELIRQGASLAAESRHIMEAYGLEPGERRPETGSDLSPEEKLILTALRGSGGSIEVDKLADMTKLEPQVINQNITFLIIKNLVKETELGYVIC